MRQFLKLSWAAFCFFALAACQELRGPVWSPDGKRVAFAAYANGAAGKIDASLYVLDADDENAEPELVAKGAAFPYWTPDSQTLYFLGERDAQGFYAKVFKWRSGGGLQVALSSNGLTDFQLSADASVALLGHGLSARPGAPEKVDLWNMAADKPPEALQLAGEVYSPALMPNGKYLAYAKPLPDALPQLFVCKLDGTAPLAIFPTEKEIELNASTYIIQAFPDNDRFLFYAPGGSALWSIRHDGSTIRKYPLPEGLSAPVMVAFAEDSSSATVTLAQAVAEKIMYQVFQVNLNTRRFTRLDGDSAELLGGHALDPRSVRRKGPPRYAWLSAAGLAIGEPGRARYYPLNANQCIAASALQIKQNEPKKAVASALKAREYQPPPDDLSQLERAEALAYLADQQPMRAGVALERSMLLYPIGPEGLKFIFPASTGLPAISPAELGATLKEMNALIKALPENRLLPKLSQALIARSQGKQAQALACYREAFPIAPDDASGGGVRFLEAVCVFEMGGDLRLAAEKWEAAARSVDFPQAGYAAGLSAIAYYLSEHPEKVNTVLQLAAARNSPLAGELAQLPAELNGKAYVVREKSKESVSADNSVRCWVEYEHYQIPFATLTPRRTLEREGKYAERRIGTQTVTVSSVWLAGIPQPVFRIPRAITAPKISPNNLLLAFTAAGEVFPLPDDFCEVFVIDKRGTMVFGDPRAVFTSRGQGRRIIKTLVWLDAQQLAISGSEVDVFGGETPFNKPLTVVQQRVRELGKP